MTRALTTADIPGRGIGTDSAPRGSGLGLPAKGRGAQREVGGGAVMKTWGSSPTFSVLHTPFEEQAASTCQKVGETAKASRK